MLLVDRNRLAPHPPVLAGLSRSANHALSTVHLHAHERESSEYAVCTADYGVTVIATGGLFERPLLRLLLLEELLLLSLEL